MNGRDVCRLGVISRGDDAIENGADLNRQFSRLGERVFLADLLREILYNPNRALALLVCFPTDQFSTKDLYEKWSHDENPDVAFFARKFSKKKAIKEFL